MATKLLLSKKPELEPRAWLRSPPMIEALAENVLARTIELASPAAQLAFVDGGVRVLNIFFPFKERF